MTDFQQNIFSQQFGNSQAMPIDQIHPQMNPNFQNFEMLNQPNPNSSQNTNIPQMYQIQQPQQPNQNSNNNTNSPNNLDINFNSPFNFDLSKETQNQNNQENNINNINDNINLNSNNNFDMNFENKSDVPQINLNKNKNKKKNNPKEQIPNNNQSQNDSEEAAPEPKKTKLENKFSFLYRIDDNNQYQPQKKILAKEKYESQVKKIAEFDTIEDFWDIFQHLRKPDSCRPGIEFFMFKGDIKPLWEDENNKNGGRFSIKLAQGYTTIIWEEMIFTLIGGILPKEIKDEINGIVVTSKKEFNTLQIWFKTFDSKITKEIEKCIREILVIPDEVKLEPKQFNVNLNNTDNTSNNNNKNNSINKDNNKKEYGNYNNNNNNKNNNNKNNNNNNKNNNNRNNNKSGGFREKGHYNNNNNYYYEEEYEYDNNYYNKDYKKNKYQSRKNKK